MKTRSLLIAVVFVMVGVFFAAGIYAGNKAPDVIKMKNPAYAEHTKGIVEFSHTKHAVDYAKKAPDLYKDKCGACHHDDKGKPLVNLKDGDEVQSCIACHKIPGEKPKGKDAPKLSKQEELAYHAEAVHENCQACHKAHNKATNTKDAPTTCVKCHPKTE
jgi:hypothetical protein